MMERRTAAVSEMRKGYLDQMLTEVSEENVDRASVYDDVDCCYNVDDDVVIMMMMMVMIQMMMMERLQDPHQHHHPCYDPSSALLKRTKIYDHRLAYLHPASFAAAAAASSSASVLLLSAPHELCPSK